MSDQDPQRKPATLVKSRTPTFLNAMGSLAQARPSREMPEERDGRRPDEKVVLGNLALHRSDITEGRLGIPLTLTLKVVDAANGRAPIAGANVEIWHCDADGVFSDYASKMYPDAAMTTYLRGGQTTDRVGQVTFRTIYPGWFGARATHVHVRVYKGATPKKALQLGFPDQVNAIVYGDADRYVKGPNPTGNDADEVFGSAHGNGRYGGRQDFQIAAVAGDNANGYVGTVAIAIESFG